MQMIGLPAGFRDVMFEEAKARRIIETRMAAVFSSHGYAEIQPSGIESIEVYQRGHQGVRDRAFRFLDRQDNLLALRADFTPAIARIAASRLSAAPLPIRLWYSGSVFRKVDSSHRGYAELGQIGAELLGLNSIEGDADILRLAMECLVAIGIEDIQVHINHAGVFRGIVSALGLDGKDMRTIRSEIDRKDARGIEAQLKTLSVEEDLQAQIHTLSTSIGGPAVLTSARKSIRSDESRNAIDHLEAVASALGSWKDRLVFDLAEIDEMEYYTGIMVAFLSPKLNREIGTGGRYDSLLKEFGRDLPAGGFSLSVESLVELQ
jgi:ATP phosphoribosyltransferase regulatory subunit